MKMRQYNVYLNNRLIDGVFYESMYNTKKEREKDIYNSLVNHDYYDNRIIVKED